MECCDDLIFGLDSELSTSSGFETSDSATILSSTHTLASFYQQPTSPADDTCRNSGEILVYCSENAAPVTAAREFAQNGPKTNHGSSQI